MSGNEITIAGRKITQDGDAFVVAEIGHNHGGNLGVAMQMCRIARDCGCDAVKLQKRTNTAIFTKAMYGASYNSEHAYGPTYGAHREALEFDYYEYRELKSFCDHLGLVFFSTAFDEYAADFLEDVGVAAYKIASGDLNNLSLIEHCAKKNKPLILSTGGATEWDIILADRRLVKHDAQAAFLHCVALYPTPPDRVNLSAISKMRDLLPHRLIGYSCHYNGIVMAELSYTYGARIIEKHFTLDHTSKGSDHALSLQPDGMRKMVRDLRRIRLAHGTGEKTRTEDEAKALAKMEKVLWPTASLPAGHVLKPGDISIKTPATPDGLAPYKKDDLIGKILIFDVTTNAPFAKTVVGD
jgi:N-acetylneuraminate synthase/sialic acid synthase